MKPKRLNSTGALFSALLISTLITSVHSEEETSATAPHSSPFSIGAEGGTTGFGPVVNFRLAERFSLSLAHGRLDGDFDDAEGTDIKYDGEVDMNNTTLIANWYPSKSGFHLSAGAALVDNEIAITGRPDDDTTITIGDNEYTSTEVSSITGNVVNDNSIAPYVGMGWTWNLGQSGFSLMASVGVIVSDQYETTLSAEGTVVDEPEFILDLRKEEKEISDSLEFYPVAKFGFLYRF